MSATHAPDLALVRCPQCAAGLVDAQDWCLACGAPARTRIAPTPNWRVPALAAVAALAIAGGGLAYAFVKLSDDTGSVGPATTSATAAPAVTSTPATTAETVTALPSATTPPATAAPPATPAPTTGAPTVPATPTVPAAGANGGKSRLPAH